MFLATCPPFDRSLATHAGQSAKRLNWVSKIYFRGSSSLEEFAACLDCLIGFVSSFPKWGGGPGKLAGRSRTPGKLIPNVEPGALRGTPAGKPLRPRQG